MVEIRGGAQRAISAYFEHRFGASSAQPNGAVRAASSVSRTFASHATKILIVEDEPLVRMLAVEVLEPAGFNCVEAPSGDIAMEEMRRTPESFAAALIDLGLPDRPGDEVAADIHKLHAELPILIVSGRDESEIRERMSGLPVGIMLKPYTGAMLLEALTKLGVTAPH